MERAYQQVRLKRKAADMTLGHRPTHIATFHGCEPAKAKEIKFSDTCFQVTCSTILSCILFAALPSADTFHHFNCNRIMQ